MQFNTVLITGDGSGGATTVWQRSCFTVRSKERPYGAITVNAGMECIMLNATDPQKIEHQKIEHYARALVIIYPSQNVSINKGSTKEL